MTGVVFLHEISIPKNQNSFLTLHGFTNIDRPMQQSIDLLRRKLGEIYPPGEIIGFTRMIFESLCGYTPTDILLHKDTILSEDIHRKIERITDRLSQQEPIQYILGFTLALSLPGSKVEAWDISTEALEIAQRNARKHNAHVNFFQRDILRYDVSELPEESLDIIVSNPPYIRRCESRSMSANVLEYEPHIALFVPNESPSVL